MLIIKEMAHFNPDEVNKCKNTFETMKNRSSPMGFFPRFDLVSNPAYDSVGKIEEKIKGVNDPIISSPSFIKACTNTLGQMLKVEDFFYMRISSVDHEQEPFFIFDGEQFSEGENYGEFSSCQIYGEMYINLDSSSGNISLEINPYSSPREIRDEDIYYLKNRQGVEFDLMKTVFKNVIESLPLQRKMNIVYYFMDQYISEILETQKISPWISISSPQERMIQREKYEERYLWFKKNLETQYGIKNGKVENENEFSFYVMSICKDTNLREKLPQEKIFSISVQMAG